MNNVASVKSSSSIIKEWFLTNTFEDGMPKMTSKELAISTGTTDGSASGFMDRAGKAGIAEKVGRKQGQIVWMIDIQKMPEMRVKNKPSHGSIKGRKSSAGRGPSAYLPDENTPKPPEYDPVTVLMECAAYLERARSPLSAYTTEELIDELHSRHHKK